MIMVYDVKTKDNSAYIKSNKVNLTPDRNLKRFEL